MADHLSLSEIDACIAELRGNIRQMTEAAALSAPADGDSVGDRIEQASIELEELMARRDVLLASPRV